MRSRMIQRGTCLIAMCAAAFLGGCGDDDRMGPEGVDLTTFEGVVAYGGVYEKVAPSEHVSVIESGEEIGDDGTVFVCTTQRRSVVDAPDDYEIGRAHV